MARLVLLSSEIQPYSLKDDGTFPNNEHLPVLFYEDCLQAPANFAAAPAIEALFKSNNWGGTWHRSCLRSRWSFAGLLDRVAENFVIKNIDCFHFYDLKLYIYQ